MTIIDFLRQKLTEYPKISEFMAGADIHIDFTDPDPTNYGLSSTGDSLIREDVLGNQIRQHNFVMYAVAQSFTDYNRLERLPEEDGISVEDDNQAMIGIFLKATSANAMAMQPMTEDINDGVLYQIQIYAQYKIESEEF